MAVQPKGGAEGRDDAAERHEVESIAEALLMLSSPKSPRVGLPSGEQSRTRTLPANPDAGPIAASNKKPTGSMHHERPSELS